MTGRWTSPSAPHPVPHLIAWLLVIAYAITFSWLAILRHASFNSNAFDLGLFDQTVWNTLQGRIFFYTTTGEPLLHLSNHADFILLLIAPFYLIYSGPETLLMLQAWIIALGALPLFWFARQQLNNALIALSLLLAYLLFPGLALVTLRDFHPPGLATGFLMFAFYALVTDRPKWFLTWATLAMMCKEQIPLLIVFMGLYALIIQKKWLLGFLSSGYGLAWFLSVMYVIIPAYSVTGEHIFLNYYAYLGDSPAEIIFTTLTRPDLIWQNLWQGQKLRYLLHLMLPFACLPFFGLPVLLIGTPAFAINLLSTNPALHDTTVSHYVAEVAPWVAWGAVFGLINIKRGVRRIIDRLYVPARMDLWLTNCLTLLITTCAVYFHYHHGHSPLAPHADRWAVTQHAAQAQTIIDQIPPEASLSAQGSLYAHVSQRLIAYQFPDIVARNHFDPNQIGAAYGEVFQEKVEYIFLDVTSRPWPMHPNDYKRAVDELLQAGQYGILAAKDGYLLLKRGLKQTTFPKTFYSFAYPHAVRPQYPVEIDFDHQLQFLGFDVIDQVRQEKSIVRLYWRTLRSIDDELQLYPFFLNTEGNIVEDTRQRPMTTQIWHPPQTWQVGKVVQTETLLWPLGDTWSLAVAVLAGPDPNWQNWPDRLPITAIETKAENEVGLSPRLFEARTWARIATFTRRNNKSRDLVLAQTHLNLTADMISVYANFDNQMALLGYQVEKTNQTELRLTLHWEALTNMALDYTIFVHLLDPEGNLIAQHDAGPWWQVPLPTSTWLSGEHLLDQHRLTLPDTLNRNKAYHLRLGVYYWQTSKRLPTITSDGQLNQNYIDLEEMILAFSPE